MAQKPARSSCWGTLACMIGGALVLGPLLTIDPYRRYPGGAAVGAVIGWFLAPVWKRGFAALLKKGRGLFADPPRLEK